MLNLLRLQPGIGTQAGTGCGSVGHHILGHRDHTWLLMKNFKCFSRAHHGGFPELEDGGIYGVLR